MSSDLEDGDLTARAAIRNAALRLFAEHGHDAVTVRQIAAVAGVSPALVVHHFGSKEGLREAVDAHAAQAFEAIFGDEGQDDLVATMLAGNSTSLAEAFARGFPPGSPLPAYLRRLLLTNDPAGAALFGRWFAMTAGLMEQMAAAGFVTPTDDPAARAALLLVNDLGLILLRNQVATTLGVDPLSPEGMTRLAATALTIYSQGFFLAPPPSPAPKES